MAGHDGREGLIVRWHVWRLHSSDRATRETALDKLVEMKSPLALPHLIRIVEGAEAGLPLLRCGMADLSGNVSEPIVLGPVAEALYRIGKPALPAIERAIEQGRADLLALRGYILEPERYQILRLAPFRPSPWLPSTE